MSVTLAAPILGIRQGEDGFVLLGSDAAALVGMDAQPIAGVLVVRGVVGALGVPVLWHGPI
jgi:hypothetical protein